MTFAYTVNALHQSSFTEVHRPELHWAIGNGWSHTTWHLHSPGKNDKGQKWWTHDDASYTITIANEKGIQPCKVSGLASSYDQAASDPSVAYKGLSFLKAMAVLPLVYLSSTKDSCSETRICYKMFLFLVAQCTNRWVSCCVDFLNGKFWGMGDSILSILESVKFFADQRTWPKVQINNRKLHLTYENLQASNISEVPQHAEAQHKLSLTHWMDCGKEFFPRPLI